MMVFANRTIEALRFLDSSGNSRRSCSRLLQCSGWVRKAVRRAKQGGPGLYQAKSGRVKMTCNKGGFDLDYRNCRLVTLESTPGNRFALTLRP